MAQKNNSVKSLPDGERPRERLLSIGSSALSLSELISIVIGKGAPDEPVNLLSEKLISKYGSIKELSRLTVQELMSTRGIGLAKACQIVASFEIGRRVYIDYPLKSFRYDESDKVHILLKPYLTNRVKEYFVVVTLDSRKRLIAVDNISIGTVDQALVHPREVFKTAIERRASSIIIAHNHPSGDPSPSKEDIVVTKRLYNVSTTIGIPLIDHIIISDNSYFSLRDKNLLENILE